MACFVVPATEAVVTTIINKHIKKNEAKTEKENSQNGIKENDKIRFSEKLSWLNKMLWGGSALLAFEHLWHGEIVPFFPFFTAASDKASLVTMFKEMATVGVSMAILVTAVWGVMVAVSSAIERKSKLSEDNN